MENIAAQMRRGKERSRRSLSVSQALRATRTHPVPSYAGRTESALFTAACRIIASSRPGDRPRKAAFPATDPALPDIDLKIHAAPHYSGPSHLGDARKQ